MKHLPRLFASVCMSMTVGMILGMLVATLAFRGWRGTGDSLNFVLDQGALFGTLGGWLIGMIGAYPLRNISFLSCLLWLTSFTFLACIPAILLLGEGAPPIAFMSGLCGGVCGIVVLWARNQPRSET